MPVARMPPQARAHKQQAHDRATTQRLSIRTLPTPVAAMSPRYSCTAAPTWSMLWRPVCVRRVPRLSCRSCTPRRAALGIVSLAQSVATCKAAAAWSTAAGAAARNTGRVQCQLLPPQLADTTRARRSARLTDRTDTSSARAFMRISSMLSRYLMQWLGHEYARMFWLPFALYFSHFSLLKMMSTIAWLTALWSVGSTMMPFCRGGGSRVRVRKHHLRLACNRERDHAREHGAAARPAL
jgi:hypothetical protein